MARADIQICRSISIDMYHPHPPANVLQEIYRDTGVAVKAFSMEGMSHELVRCTFCDLRHITFISSFIFVDVFPMQQTHQMNIYPRDVTNNVGLFEALRRIIPLAVLSTMDGHFCLPLLVSEQQCSSLLGKNAATLRGLRFRSGCRIKISQSRKWQTPPTSFNIQNHTFKQIHKFLTHVTIICHFLKV